jgi:FkbM family methyltransferase
MMSGRRSRLALMDVFLDSRFEPLYRAHPLVLVDAGARGGLKSNWREARRHLRVIGFEPDPIEFERLSNRTAREGQGDRVLGTALHNQPGNITLQIARDRGLSSIFEPDRDFVDAFPDAQRFDTVDRQSIPADTLDRLLAAHGERDVDFVKADTQGSELFVLQGASGVLRTSAVGVEVEVEFSPIYRGQPLFADVDAFLRGLGFLLFDLRPCYWKRAAGRALGGPYGQVIWGDALYLRASAALGDAMAGLAQDQQRAKRLKAVSVALLYGYFDFALELVEGSAGVLTEDDRRIAAQRIRDGGTLRPPLPGFPGKRQLSAALRRLARLFDEPTDDWSVSDPESGNPR